MDGPVGFVGDVIGPAVDVFLRHRGHGFAHGVSAPSVPVEGKGPQQQNDHARHQQAAAQPAVNSFFPTDPVQPSPQEAPAPIVDDPSAELPPLDPVVTDEAPQTKEVHPDTLSPAAQPVADAPTQQLPTEEATEEPVPQVDDFVEVPMEALDSLQ